MDAKSVEYQKMIAWEAKPYFPKLLEGPISLEVTFLFPFPKRWRKKDKIDKPHISRPDLDNLVKAIKDALNGIAWKDDAQIYSIKCTKSYSSGPLISIKIKEM